MPRALVVVDPALRRRGVEVAQVLRLLDRVAGELDPDVRTPELVALAHADQVADGASVAERDDARRAVEREQRLDLGPCRRRILVLGREQRLGSPVGALALGEQLAGRVQELVGKWSNLEARHRRETIALDRVPKTLTGEELQLDDGPARDSELFLVDGNNLAYRAFFALPEELATSDGFPTNALLGFANMLFKLLSDYKPKGVAVAWDTRPTERAAIAQAGDVVYKEGRQADARPPARAVPALPADRRGVRLPQPRVRGLGGRRRDRDARDPRRRGRDQDDCVVSTDRDAFQLCSANVALMMTPRGVADVNVYTPERVELRYGVRPDQVPDFIGLKGDTSDNIPGVPGIGDKTAGQLIAQYGSLEEVIAHADELSPARRKNITEHADQARMSKELATMRRDLDLDFDPAELVLEPPDRSQLKEMFRRFEFRALLNRIDDLDDAVPSAVARARGRHDRPLARGRAAAGARPRRHRDRGRPLRARAGRRRRRRRRGTTSLPARLQRGAARRARRQGAAPADDGARRRHADRRVPDRARPLRVRARRPRSASTASS